MIIKNFVHKEDGSMSFKLDVNKEESEALMELAVKVLISNGLIDLDQQDYQDEFSFFEDNSDEGGTLQ